MTEHQTQWHGYGHSNLPLVTSAHQHGNFYYPMSTSMWDESPSEQPIPIGEALRQHCRVPARQYFAVVVLDNGEIQYYSDPPGLADDLQLRSQFFHELRFRQNVEYNAGSLFKQEYFDPRSNGHASKTLDSPSALYSLYQSGSISRLRSGRSRKPLVGLNGTFSPSDLDVETAVSTSARQAGVSTALTLSLAAIQGCTGAAWDDVALRVEVVRTHEKIQAHYAALLGRLQQMACKLLAKAWIKVVEPKKQSAHPYTMGDAAAPPWWPRPWGSRQDERVRHKEPDHLLKRERVHLLVHILGLVVLPREEQRRELRPLNLSVRRLADAAYEALGGWFSEGAPSVDVTTGEGAVGLGGSTATASGTPAGNNDKKAWLDALMRLAELEQNEILRMRKNGFTASGLSGSKGENSDEDETEAEQLAKRTRGQDIRYELPDNQLAARARIRREEGEDDGLEDDEDGDSSSRGGRKRRRSGRNKAETDASANTNTGLDKSFPLGSSTAVASCNPTLARLSRLGFSPNSFPQSHEEVLSTQQPDTDSYLYNDLSSASEIVVRPLPDTYQPTVPANSQGATTRGYSGPPPTVMPSFVEGHAEGGVGRDMGVTEAVGLIHGSSGALFAPQVTDFHQHYC